MLLFQCYLFSVIGFFGATLAAPPPNQPTKAQAITSPPLTLDDVLFLQEPSSSLGNSSHANASLSALDPAIGAIRCLSESPRTARQRPIVMDDYYEAVEVFLTDERAMVPQTYTLRPDRPFSIVHYSCGIVLETRTGLFITPPFAKVFLAHVAALIVNRCLTEETRYLGGAAYLWANRATLWVINPHRLDPPVGAQSS